MKLDKIEKIADEKKNIELTYFEIIIKSVKNFQIQILEKYKNIEWSFWKKMIVSKFYENIKEYVLMFILYFFIINKAIFEEINNFYSLTWNFIVLLSLVLSTDLLSKYCQMNCKIIRNFKYENFIIATESSDYKFSYIILFTVLVLFELGNYFLIYANSYYFYFIFFMFKLSLLGKLFISYYSLIVIDFLVRLIEYYTFNELISISCSDKINKMFIYLIEFFIINVTFFFINKLENEEDNYRNRINEGQEIIGITYSNLIGKDDLKRMTILMMLTFILLDIIQIIFFYFYYFILVTIIHLILIYFFAASIVYNKFNQAKVILFAISVYVAYVKFAFLHSI